MKRYVFKTDAQRAHSVRKKVYNQNFNEPDIIELHNSLLLGGAHYITADSIVTGRRLVTTFFERLSQFKTCALLTDLPLTMSNHITLYPYMDSSIDLTELYIDYIWIEKTDTLQSHRSFKKFYNYLTKEVTIASILTINYIGA